MFAQYRWKRRYDFQLAFRKRLKRLSGDAACAFCDAAHVLWPVVNKALSGAHGVRRKACKCLDLPGKIAGLRRAYENPNGEARI
jgi:hypothetical protein